MRQTALPTVKAADVQIRWRRLRSRAPERLFGGKGVIQGINAQSKRRKHRPGYRGEPPNRRSRLPIEVLRSHFDRG